MQHNLFMGLDLGTSSTKCVVIDAFGTTVSAGQANYKVFDPQPNWAVQAGKDWWNAIIKSSRQALSGCDPNRVAGIGITGQMHGLVALDQNNELVLEPIIWTDTRTEVQVRYINSVPIPKLTQQLGGFVATGFLLPSLLWLKQNELDLYAKIHTVLTPKDYIRFLLTSEICSEPTDACGTGAFDVSKQTWHAELLHYLEIEPELFPPLKLSMDVAGHLTKQAASSLGLPQGLPVLTGCGDVQASALGLGVTSPHQLLINMGTGAQVFQLTRDFFPDTTGRFHTMCHADGIHWHVLGAILNAGLAIDWAARVFSSNVASFLDSKSSTPACDSGLYFLPYLIGERTPYMDSDLSAALSGLRLFHTGSDMSRAILEGIGFALFHAYQLTRGASPEVHSVRVGGGPVDDQEFRQLLADIFGLPIELSARRNSSALGAAFIALSVLTKNPLGDIAIGLSSVPACVKKPCMVRHERYRDCFEEFKYLSAQRLKVTQIRYRLNTTKREGGDDYVG